MLDLDSPDDRLFAFHLTRELDRKDYDYSSLENDVPDIIVYHHSSRLFQIIIRAIEVERSNSDCVSMFSMLYESNESNDIVFEYTSN